MRGSEAERSGPARIGRVVCEEITPVGRAWISTRLAHPNAIDYHS